MNVRSKDVLSDAELQKLWSDFEENALHEMLLTPIPGPRSQELAQVLQQCEAREVTFFSKEFPIFWEHATGSTVTDADGNRYLDFSAAFGVAALGHNHPQVMNAVMKQSQALLHGMGDVHPSTVRVELLTRLAALTPGTLAHGFLGLNGADAIEFARKTALLVNQRPVTLIFEGGYHGLSYGALEVIGIPAFRDPFLAQLSNRSMQLPYPTEGSVALDVAIDRVRTVLQAHHEIGAILIEPIAGRAGTLVPVTGFLPALRQLADEFQTVLIFDEIYTGFGRTGTMFACEDEQVTPDILCLGKALGGGVPLSVAIGTPEIMNAWPRSNGEALHTATFLANPLGCAAALAVIEALETLHLPARAGVLGGMFGGRLHDLANRLHVKLGYGMSARGRGLMWALDLDNAEVAAQTVFCALRKGLILLQQGINGTALALTPPLTIAHHQLEHMLEILEASILEAAS